MAVDIDNEQITCDVYKHKVPDGAIKCNNSKFRHAQVPSEFKELIETGVYTPEAMHDLVRKNHALRPIDRSDSA